MMKNTGFIILLLAVLLLGNIFTAYKYISLQKNAAEIVNADNVTITNLHEEMEITRGNFRQSLNWQYEYEGQPIEHGKVVNQEGVYQDLYSIAKHSAVLIYRITELSCDACYDNVTAKLKDASAIIGGTNILVIVPIRELRNTVTAFAKQGINVTVLAAQEDFALGIGLEKGSSPFFFVMNSSLTVSHLFIPHKNGVEMTADYLSIVSKKFFVP